VIRDVLVDTGPLIALVDRRDRHHDWVRARFNEILPPLITCEAVLAEACFLAQRVPGGVPAVLGLFEQGVCSLTFALGPHFDEVAAYMQKYVDVPCSLADACLVRMSELTPKGVVFTLDRDFRIYRRNKRQLLPLLMPPEH
jgi:predicted nucleic acid-binding protein